MNEARDRRLRTAVDLVLADVRACLGPDSVAAVIVGEPGALAELERTNPSLLDHLTSPRTSSLASNEGGLAYVVGESGAVGLMVYDDEPLAQLVKRVADLIQDLVVESSRFFASVVPECPLHGTHPLFPAVEDTVAVWRCQTSSYAVQIGVVGEVRP